jgi:hypothetical protein
MEEFDLQGHLNALEVEDNYLISNELDVESSSPEEIAGALNGASVRRTRTVGCIV